MEYITKRVLIIQYIKETFKSRNSTLVDIITPIDAIAMKTEKHEEHLPLHYFSIFLLTLYEEFTSY